MFVFGENVFVYVFVVLNASFRLLVLAVRCFCLQRKWIKRLIHNKNIVCSWHLYYITNLVTMPTLTINWSGWTAVIWMCLLGLQIVDVYLIRFIFMIDTKFQSHFPIMRNIRKIMVNFVQYSWKWHSVNHRFNHLYEENTKSTCFVYVYVGDFLTRFIRAYLTWI